MEETTSTIKAVTEELLAKLTVSATVVVSYEEDGYRVQIETEEPGILIGYHGKNLESVQLLLRQILFKKLGAWSPLFVSVGDYRERRAEQLKEMAFAAVQQVMEKNEEVILPELSPAERRTVHVLLQDHPDAVSESTGEGRNRRLVIKPRSQA